eukprot:TRINITY_DN42096_c0_g1_i1.p1 TRINITY_DN42096_c0_g1~~TRINITY_DN42096_c0_g1_i1.p1  ORF type:complete len:233 (+),score=26.50 TRINITY_DN42096_c0_g1_i1:153-851(+)
MRRVVVSLGLCGLVIGQGQNADPVAAAQEMMIGQAGKVAGVLAQKAEQTLAQKMAAPTQTCSDDHCCPGSTCMGIPGFQCKDSHGTTTCVGSNALGLKEGVCRCITGPCNAGGFCPDAPSIGGKSPGGGTPASPAAPGAALGAASFAGEPVSAPPPTAVLTPWSRLYARGDVSDAADSAGFLTMGIGRSFVCLAAGAAVLVGIARLLRRRNTHSDEDDDESNETPLVSSDVE